MADCDRNATKRRCKGVSGGSQAGRRQPLTHQDTFRQEEEAAEQKVHAEDDDGRGDDACHGRACAKFAGEPAPRQAPKARGQAAKDRGNNVGRSQGDELPIGADRVAVATGVFLGGDDR